MYQIGRNIAASAPGRQLFVALQKTIREHDIGNVHVHALAGELDLALHDASYAEEISQDYTRLFIGPHIPAPIWESVWRDEENLLFGKDTLIVRDFYQKIGLAFEKNATEPDDHMALELEFMWVLNAGLLGAMQNSDYAMIQESCHLQQQFLAEHVLQWIPQTSEILEQAAQTTFYRLFARMLISFLPMDYQFLQEFLTHIARVPQSKENAYA